jgi:hypothetical protein
MARIWSGEVCVRNTTRSLLGTQALTSQELFESAAILSYNTA